MGRVNSGVHQGGRRSERRDGVVGGSDYESLRDNRDLGCRLSEYNGGHLSCGDGSEWEIG